MLYALVIAVAISEGPLVSIQSFVLGITGLIAFILLISSIAKKIGLVDISDNIRKNHQGSVPLIGGLVLYISFVYGSIVFGINPFYINVLLSIVPIIIVGTLDGIRNLNLPISFRLIAQIISSWFLIISTDIYVTNLGDLFGYGDINIGTLGIPFTIFGVVGVCNAFNMLDGKDGLTGSVSVITFSFLLLLLYSSGQSFNLGLIVITSLLVFLGFNLNLFGAKRKIFLGDHGSNGLGHITAWILIYLSQEQEIITPISAIYFIFIPVTDALLTFYRRLRSSKQIFKPDRQHFHHILSDFGFSDIKVLLIIISFSIIAGFIAVLSIIYGLKEYYLLFGYLTILFIAIILNKQKKTEK